MSFSVYYRCCDEEIFLSPVIELPHVFELSYYGNQVISVFALESVIGKSNFENNYIACSLVQSTRGTNIKYILPTVIHLQLAGILTWRYWR